MWRDASLAQRHDFWREPVPSYDIVLDSEPTGDVTVEVSSAVGHNGDQQFGVKLSANRDADFGPMCNVTFGASNWNLPQTVAIDAIDDDQWEGMKGFMELYSPYVRYSYELSIS